MIEKPESAETDFPTRPLRAGLYIVATPIGNLRDITLRALEVLRSADMILCEDTRVTRKLLSAFQIKAKTQSYNDHSDDNLRQKIIGWLEEGKKIALVSDAGMPLISDPGYKLVQSCHAAGVYVTTLPGANAPLAALQLSGLPSDKFCFLGFFPNKTNARKKLLTEWIKIPATLIAFDTAPRLLASLSDIQDIMGKRNVAVVREITKLYEEVRKGTPQELMALYESKGLPKGEIVIVIAPPTEEIISEEDIDNQIRTALKTMKTKEAASFIAEKTGLNKKDVYEKILNILKD